MEREPEHIEEQQPIKAKPDGLKNIDIEAYKKEFCCKLENIMKGVEIVNAAAVLAVLGLVIFLVLK